MARRRAQSPLPPPLEAACLSTLWEIGEGTVRDVLVAMAPRQKLAYTTVLTLLDRLVRRNQALRRKVGRRFVYSPAKEPDTVREAALSELVNLYFSGSRAAFQNWLSGSVSNSTTQSQSDTSAMDTTLL